MNECPKCGGQKYPGEPCQGCGYAGGQEVNGIDVGQFVFKGGDIVLVQCDNQKQAGEVAVAIRDAAMSVGQRVTVVMGRAGQLSVQKLSGAERRFLAAKLLETNDPIVGVEHFISAKDEKPPDGVLVAHFAARRFANQELAASWIREHAKAEERPEWMTLKLAMDEPADEAPQDDATAPVDS